VGGRDVVDWWNFMSVGLRQNLRGWSANRGKESKAQKQILLSQIKELDDRADDLGIGPEEWAFRYHLEGQMMSLFRQEEEYWRQKGRVCWSTLGDANTAYFHAVANGRRRKCNISSLNTSGGVITDKRLIQEHVYDFYRELLGSSEPRSCSLAAFAWEESERVSGAENEDLMRTLTEQELEGIVMSMKSDTAPGPDGFPVGFLKKIGV
jgi:mannosylglycoprotein endo-beta-mannosidase